MINKIHQLKKKNINKYFKFIKIIASPNSLKCVKKSILSIK